MRLFPSTVVSNSELPMMFGPNITGWFTLGRNSGHVSKVDGTLFYFGEYDSSAAATADANDAQHAVFDPSRANQLFGSASTVQVASLKALACIKI